MPLRPLLRLCGPAGSAVVSGQVPRQCHKRCRALQAADGATKKTCAAAARRAAWPSPCISAAASPTHSQLISDSSTRVTAKEWLVLCHAVPEREEGGLGLGKRLPSVGLLGRKEGGLPGAGVCVLVECAPCPLLSATGIGGGRGGARAGQEEAGGTAKEKKGGGARKRGSYRGPAAAAAVNGPCGASQPRQGHEFVSRGG